VVTLVDISHVSKPACSQFRHFMHSTLMSPAHKSFNVFSGLETQNIPSHGGSCLPSNTWFLWPTGVCASDGIASFQPFLHSTQLCPAHITLCETSVAVGCIYALSMDDVTKKLQFTHFMYTSVADSGQVGHKIIFSILYNENLPRCALNRFTVLRLFQVFHPSHSSLNFTKFKICF